MKQTSSSVSTAELKEISICLERAFSLCVNKVKKKVIKQHICIEGYNMHDSSKETDLLNLGEMLIGIKHVTTNPSPSLIKDPKTKDGAS